MKRLRIMAATLFAFAAAFFMPVPSAAQTEMPAPRVALVYTVTTPELKADVERALRESVGGMSNLWYMRCLMPSTRSVPRIT